MNNNKENNFGRKWRSLIENSPERIITLDRNGIVLFINKTPPNMTVEEAIGKSVYNFLPTDEQKKLRKILHKVFETGKPHKYIGKTINNNGSEVWYECSIAGIKDNGQVIAAIINCIDITELKLSQLKLKKSEEKYRNLINNLNDAVVEVDFEGPILYISPQITRILGYTPDELIGTNGYELIHPDDYDRVIKIIQDSLKAKIPIYYEAKAKHKEGYYVPISVYGTYLKEGYKGRIIGIARDNSEIKETEQKLREAEEKYRIIFEKSSNAIVLIDLTGKIIECNLSTVKIFGYSKEELIDKNYLNLPIYSENMKATLEEGFKRIIKGHDIKPQKLEIKRKDGTLATVTNKISYLKIGEQNFFQAIIQDITEQKKAEEYLKESEEKFRIIAENSLIGIVIIQNNTILYANETLAKMLEITTQELVDWSGEEMFSMIHPDDRIMVIQRFNAINRKEQDVSIPKSYRVITKSGKIKWLSNYNNIITYLGKEAILGGIVDITDRKEIQQKLKKSEENYRKLSNLYKMILESITDAVFALDKKWRFILYNNASEKITQVQRKNLLGKKIYKVFPGIENTSFFKIFEKVLISGKAERLVDFFTLPYGKKGYYEANVYSIQEGILCIAKDVTEEKQILLKLEKSEENYKNLSLELETILDIIPGIIFCKDNKDRVIRVNKAFAEFLQMNKEEMIGKTTFDLFPKEQADLFRGNDLEIIKSGKAKLNIEEKVTGPRGEIFSITNKVPLLDDRGEVASIIGLAFDITERKRMEQKLKESEEKFRTIADQSLIGIDILQEGKVIYVNNALSTIIGFPIEEIRNWKPRNYHKLIHPEDLNQVFESILKVQDGKTGSTIRYSCRIITKNKKIKWVEIFAKLIMFQGKRAVLSSTIDITAKMKAEKKLKEISQMKSELLQRTSHELKTPLVSIKGFSDLLLQLHSDKLDTDAISLVDEINQGCIRLENLIKDILKTSELDLGKTQLKREMEDLAFLINFSIKELRGLAEVRSQTIEVDIHDSLITKFEKERIHEVLGNLIMNAIKYTPTKGHIKIQTEINNGFYIISVKDNGIGFTNKEKSKLFTQFGKIEHFGQGLDVISDGSGLGLFISKKIIELHGGEIWVDSEGRNKGSTFYFSLPIISD